MAQMLTGSLVRLIVTVVTLAAIYFFILRPVLDTTETLDKSFSSPVDIQREINNVYDDAGVNNVKVPRQGLKQARKMLACVEKAGDDATALSLCAAQ